MTGISVKRARFRSPRYLAFVRTLPCAVCGGPADDAHHITGLHMGLTGMGTKPGDQYTLPVDRQCHNAIHAQPALQALQPQWLLSTLSAGMRAFPQGEIHEALIDAHNWIWTLEGAPA